MTESTHKIIRNSVNRFWFYVHKGINEKDCWEWKGRKNKKGYGIIKLQGKGISAHRYSYYLHFGVAIPPNDLVCHKCDNPSCVNPSHLFLGSIQDNNRDRDNKNRKALGENNGKSILTFDQVKRIKERLAFGVSDSELAREFKVWHTTIRAIRVGVTWRQI